MKILLIASTDSYNFSLPRLFTCFKEKGHDVAVLQTEYGKEHNFAIKNLPAKKYYGFVRNIRSYDFAVFENVLNEKLLQQLHSANVFCISMYFHAFPSQYILGPGYLYGNLTFSLGENFKQTQKRNGVVHEIIPTGSPQYDDIEIDSKPTEKIFLFLEQHFYPAGDKGKQQLAIALIETAQNNPEYKIIVKPRSLPEYHYQSKHKSRHIYRYIEKRCDNKIPDNLVLLNEHRDLLGLINQSCVVATTFSTAIYPCLIANKAVIWVGGFDSEDIHYYNKKVIDSYYSQYSNTGNLIHYSRLKESLLDAKPVKKNIIDSIIYKADRRAAERIVEILEFIKLNVLNRNMVLPYLDLSYENYKQKINEYIASADKENQEKVVYIQSLNRGYNANLESFYRLFMAAGFARKDIFVELKTKLMAIKKNYLEYHGLSTNGLVRYREECKHCTVNNIKRYADLLSQNKQLSEDFKSMYIRWLYVERCYDELLRLDAAFLCVDYEFYVTLVNYRKKVFNAKTLIKKLERFKEQAAATDFPLTLFYTSITANEIEKTLLFAYLKTGNILKSILAAASFAKRNRSSIVKKITSNVFGVLRIMQ